jgi:undecaprenyl diphosphate synthase
MANLPDRIPHHVAIIMDGNGRWAKQRGKMRYEGHQAGTENLRRTLRACSEFGIKILTIYAFSTENWGRPPREVAFLMRILESVLDRELDELHANGVQIRHLGLFDQVAPVLANKIKAAIERTRWNDRLILNVAFNYGGRHEIVQAVRRIAQEGIPPDQIDETLLGYYMFTGGLPDPDLIIRTSGEYRTSNFLIWQGAYSEYYFSPTYWPDFDRDELQKAIQAYAGRERRYGLLEPPGEAAE